MKKIILVLALLCSSQAHAVRGYFQCQSFPLATSYPNEAYLFGINFYANNFRSPMLDNVKYKVGSFTFYQTNQFGANIAVLSWFDWRFSNGILYLKQCQNFASCQEYAVLNSRMPVGGFTPFGRYAVQFQEWFPDGRLHKAGFGVDCGFWRLN